MHPTALYLNISSPDMYGNVEVSGDLGDKSTGSGVGGATITFTGTGAFLLAGSNLVTATNGIFSVIVQPPANQPSYTLQAHYAGAGTYGSSDSETKVLVGNQLPS
jgi:hypothetical protein